MELDDKVELLRKSIIDTEQNIFNQGSDKYNDVIDNCKNLLLYIGYKVFEPINYDHINIKDERKLVEYFHTYFAHTHPNKARNKVVNLHRDIRLAKLFVKSRMESRKISKKIALAECAEIIRTVFDNESAFNFNREITFDIFGQDRCAWITNKAIDIMNSNVLGKNRDKVEKRREELEQKYMPEDLGWEDIDELHEKIGKGENL